MASKRGSRSAEVSALGVKSVKRLCAAVDKASLVLYNYDNLVPAVLLTRYKRFLGNVVLETSGRCMETDPHTVIHVPNTGPMTGLLDGLPAPVLLSKSNIATRKYPHTLEWMKPDAHSSWVGVHSAKANAMVRSLLEARAIPQLMPYDALRSEVKYGSENSRIDFLLEESWEGDASKSKYHYVEVKSVTLAEDVDSTGQRIALFPDTVSIRAQRHLRELTAIARKGTARASVVFLVQRGDCSAFAPCWEKDPTYASLLTTAVAEGVTAVAVACELDVESKRVVFKDNLPVKLDFKAR